jgi:hypothetical protein
VRPDLEPVRPSPRWPAAEEEFAAGWEWLDAAEPLRRVLDEWPGSADPRWADGILSETLLHLRQKAGLDTLVLIASDGDVLRLRRVVDHDGDMRHPPDLVVSAEDAAARVAEALGSEPGVVFEVALCPAHAGGPPVGSLIGFGHDREGVPHTTAVLEQTAWVIARALAHGDVWRFLDRARAVPGIRADAAPAASRDEDATMLVAPPAPPAPAPEPAAPPPRRVDENVQFTVYRPRRLPPAAWQPVLAFAHLAERRADAPPGEPDPVEEVRRQAQQVLGDQAAAFADTTQDSSDAIPREGEITFVLDLPGVEVNPPQRSFRWLEDVHREEFRIRAPAALDGRTVRGALHVYLGALLVADVVLAMRVEHAGESAQAEADRARPYRRIFPSYSHRDEPIVRQVEAYARTMGDEYLRDVTHLRSGEDWNERLTDFIREADVFQLFWSRNSMTSPWVRREWEYALSLGRAHFVRPTYWEVPMPEAPERDLPPARLRSLHFQRLPIVGGPGAPPRARPAGDPATAGVAPRAREIAAREVDAARATGPAPRRHRLRLPTALAALLLVGLIGGSLVWRQVGMSPEQIESRPGATPETVPVAKAALEAVSPDGTMVASMDAEGRIRIAARAGGAPLVIATGYRPADIAALRFSPDGSRVVCELRNGERVEWDARTGTRIAGATSPLGSMA